MNKNSFVGETFGRLIVKKDIGIINKNRHYECLCICGKDVVVSRSNLRTGHTMSCGCLNKELASKRRKTHGLSKTRLHNIWWGMISRVEDKHSTSFKNYGARGISICKEWRESFENFKSWAVSNGYKKELSIDRIDNEGDYKPDNCRWADAKTQANNKRSSLPQKIGIKNTSGIVGVRYDRTRNKWVAYGNINKKNYSKRFTTKPEAIKYRQKIEDIMLKNRRDK